MKMKIITLILVFFFIMAQAGCKKEPVILPEPTLNPSNQSILAVKWRKYFYSDSVGAQYRNPYFFENYVVFCSEMPTGNTNAQLGVGVYNKLTGAKHPSWNKEPGGITPANGSISDWLIGGINNNHAVFMAYKKINCFDMESGIETWSIPSADFMPRINSWGNNMFFSNSFTTHSDLFCANISTGVQKKLITLYKTNNY